MQYAIREIFINRLHPTPYIGYRPNVLTAQTRNIWKLLGIFLEDR